MQLNQRTDLSDIFENSLSKERLDSLANAIDIACKSHDGKLILKTRNVKGDILSYQGIKYFSVINIDREKPVIFAGAIDLNLNNERIAGIRFRNQNPILESISEELKFPYGKMGWTYVALESITDDVLNRLIENEITIFLNKYMAYQLSLLTPTTSKGAASSWGFAISFLIGILMVIVGIINLNENGIVLIIFGVVIFLAGVSLTSHNGLNNNQNKLTHKEALYELYGIGDPPKQSNVRNTTTEGPDLIKCPRCKSTQISANKRGFKVGRAVSTGLITGPLGGLVVGSIGKNKIVITCLNCGHQWRPKA